MGLGSSCLRVGGGLQKKILSISGMKAYKRVACNGAPRRDHTHACMAMVVSIKLSLIHCTSWTMCKSWDHGSWRA